MESGREELYQKPLLQTPPPKVMESICREEGEGEKAFALAARVSRWVAKEGFANNDRRNYFSPD